MSPPDLTIRLVRSLHDVAAPDWDACAGAPGGGVTPNPLVSHAFLCALEESGSATEEEGWAPHHLVAERDGVITGAMPMYLKTHSYGEYVFDWGWADAFERAGGRYYPKLQVSVPFTPATGPRLLARGGDPAVQGALARAAMEIAAQNDVSSVHWTFLPEAEQERIVGLGALARQDQQFHWINRGYRDFQDFLDTLQSRKRKQIRKEREAADASGIEIVTLSGTDLTEEVWDAFFAFYTDTGARKWGTPYLTRPFFSLLGERMGDRVVLVMCRRAGRWIAGALNIAGTDTLYGRNWGAIEHHDCLHFEACYYRAIDHAIAHGLKTVEAGAQGQHKVARGYEPVLTRSAHFITHPALRDAVDRFLRRERVAVEEDAAFLRTHTPFRKG